MQFCLTGHIGTLDIVKCLCVFLIMSVTCNYTGSITLDFKAAFNIWSLFLVTLTKSMKIPAYFKP